MENVRFGPVQTIYIYSGSTSHRCSFRKSYKITWKYLYQVLIDILCFILLSRMHLKGKLSLFTTRIKGYNRII